MVCPKKYNGKTQSAPQPLLSGNQPAPPCNSWWPRLEKSSNQISWGSFTMPPICWTKKSPCQKLVTFLFFDIVSLQMWYEKGAIQETIPERNATQANDEEYPPPTSTRHGLFHAGSPVLFYTYFLPYEITPPPKINLQASEYPKMNPSVFWNFPVSLDKNWTKSNWFICRYISSPKIQLLFKFWWLLQLQL